MKWDSAPSHPDILWPFGSTPILTATLRDHRGLPDGNPAEVLSFLQCHASFLLPFDPVMICLIFCPSFQTLLLPLNLLFPSIETGFNPLVFCAASGLQSEDFISEITPNLLPHWQALPECWWCGRYHSLQPSFPLRPVWNPLYNVPQGLACGLLDDTAFGLSYFWLILLFIVASQIIYQLIWSNCIYKSIPHASGSAAGSPLMALLCILCCKYSLW